MPLRVQSGYRFLPLRKAVGVRPEDSLNQRQKKDSLGKCRVSQTWRMERSVELSRALASMRTRSRMMRPGLLPETAFLTLTT